MRLFGNTVIRLQLTGENLVDYMHRLRVVMALIVGIPTLDLAAPNHRCLGKSGRLLEKGRLGGILRIFLVHAHVQGSGLFCKRQILRAHRQRSILRVHDGLLSTIHRNVSK